MWADAIALERQWECAKVRAGARGWESESGRRDNMPFCFGKSWEGLGEHHIGAAVIETSSGTETAGEHDKLEART